MHRMIPIILFIIALLVGCTISLAVTYAPGFSQTLNRPGIVSSHSVVSSSSLTVTIPSSPDVAKIPETVKPVSYSTTLISSASPSASSVDNGQTGDFTLKSAPHVEILLGTSDGFYVYLESKNGFAGQVSISTTVQLPGNRGSDPATSPTVKLSVDNPGTTMDKPVSVLVTISTSQNTVQQMYEVIVKGVSGELEHSASVPVTVYLPSPPPRIAYSVSLGERALNNMDKIGIRPGQSLTLRSMVGPNGHDGYLGPIRFDATVTPDNGGITVKMPDPFVITTPPTYFEKSIVIDAKSTTPIGIYAVTITVTGQGNNAVESAKPQLIVTNDAGSISLTTDTSQVTLPALGFASFPYGIALHNVQGLVSMAAAATPSAAGLSSSAGGLYTFIWDESGTFWADVTTDATTPPGTYTLTITASAGQVSQSISLPLTVAPKEPSSVHLSTNSNHYTLKAGSDLQFDLTARSCGYRGTVDLSYSWSPVQPGLDWGGYNSFYAWGNCWSSDLATRLYASTGTPVGTYTLTIKATQGDISDTIQLQVTVTN